MGSWIWRVVEWFGSVLWTLVEHSLLGLWWFIDAARLTSLAEQIGFGVWRSLQQGIGWLAQGTWSKNFRHDFAQRGYKLLVALIGIYFGLFAIMEARHERRSNRAAFERSTFIDLVSSGNRGAFIAAMKNFGPIQVMNVPKEPKYWPPFEDWWTEERPQEELLHTWAYYFFDLCTPQLCGRPHPKEPWNEKKGVKIALDGARLDGARLDEVKLYRASLDNAKLDGAKLAGARLDGASLKGANLAGARLDGANLKGANLTKASDWTDKQLTATLWDQETVWPEGFTPPCQRNTREEPCATAKTP
jgi:hypothetical protein